MSKIGDFLKETGVFFLATTDGDQPKIRPLGAYLDVDGKIIFGVGNFKKVYEQLCANPKVEIVACKRNGHWLRYTGKAVFESDPKYAAMMLEKLPQVKKLYDDNPGYKMMAFHIEDAKAVEIVVMGEGENIL